MVTRTRLNITSIRTPPVLLELAKKKLKHACKFSLIWKCSVYLDIVQWFTPELYSEDISATVVTKIVYKELEIIRMDEISDLSQGIPLNWKN